MRKHTLTADVVAGAIEQVLAEAAEAGKAATVTALADRLGVQRQTLYRDFSVAVSGFVSRDTERRTRQPRPPRDPSGDREIMGRLRREKDELTRHLHIYEDHIRRLTIENARLTKELERASGVTRIPRADSDPQAL